MIALRRPRSAALALGMVAAACSGGERPSERAAPRATEASVPSRLESPSPRAASGAPALADGTDPAAAAAPTTSIGLVDAFPADLDLPVVPASNAHDAVLPPSVLPDDFAIVVRARLGAAPFVELRPRTGMPGRWELVAADVEAPGDPSVDLSESLVWSVEVPVRRVAGVYALVRANDDALGCAAPAGVATRYSRRSGRVACDGGPAALALRARLDQIVVDLAP